MLFNPTKNNYLDTISSIIANETMTCAKNALINVMEKSLAEITCLEYRLHQVYNNSAQFILYDNWESKATHQMQFTKPYILEFCEQLSEFLVKPYQYYFASELY